MTRVVLITLTVSVAITITTIAVNHLVRTTSGPAHFWADMSWAAAIASWLVVPMMWCTDRVVASNRGGWQTVGRKVDDMEDHIDKQLKAVTTRLETVEDVIEDLDHERIQANAIVVSIFKNRKSV